MNYMSKNTKSQAAIEFMMTYGWAIMVVLVSIGALAHFGVLSPDKLKPARCIVQSGLACSDFKIGDTTVTIVLANAMGRDISINRIELAGCTGTPAGPQVLRNNEKATYVIGLCDIPGKIYDAQINVSYITLDTGITHKAAGQIKAENENNNITYDYIGIGHNVSGSVSAYDFNEGDGYNISDRALDNNGIHYGNTRLLMHFDGNADDASPYNNDGILIGGLGCNAAGKSINSCNFDGVDDYIDVPGNFFLEITSKISFEAWIYTNSSANDDAGIISKGTAWGLAYNKNQSVSALVNGVSRCFISVSNNTWQHVAMTFDGNTIRCYLNGQQTGSASFAGSINNNSNNVRIGKSTSYFNGSIDEVAVYSKELSAVEIGEHYETQRAKFTDWIGGKYGTALEFDGQDDYVEVLDEKSLNITSSLTMEAWVKVYGLTGNADQDMIMNKEGIPYEIAVHDNTGPNDGIHTCGPGTDQIPAYNFAFYIGGLSGLPNHNCGWKDGGGPIALNQWSYLVVTYNNSLVKTFINGVKKKEYPASGSIQTTEKDVRIGSRGSPNFPLPTNQGALFYGAIDSLAVYNTALSEQEIYLRSIS